ncbi:MAG: hypothetical protein JWM93_105 [Frankiales bacterium]|nr:hypothetical protein [Frankiales bacterium]
MPWRPSYEGERPTLGHIVIDWMMENLAQPEAEVYSPFVPTREQAEFILAFYELDPVRCVRVVRRGVLSRSRGWGKSPITAAVAAGEGLADVVPDGWDANGQPVGMPWSRIRKPRVEIAAVSEDQVDANTWSPLIDMLSLGPAIDNHPGLEPLSGFVNLPYGSINKRTAAAGSAKGAPACMVVCDQTEEWTVSNGGIKLYNTLKNNTVKRGGHLLESPNAFTPGMGSVAENTAEAFQAMIEGKTRLESGLLVDHREAPPETNMTNRRSLMRGLRVAYGDSADVAECAIHTPPCVNPGWVDLDHVADSMLDGDADAQVSRSDFLNQITHATDSWLSQPEVKARVDATKVVADQDLITVGFDGSRGRVKGKADATALIGTRVSDGHQFEIGIWEQPDNWPKTGPVWEAPEALIDAAVRTTFKRWKVIAFYADPSGWDGHVAIWEAVFGGKLKAKVTNEHPIRWPKNQISRVISALKAYHSAITSGEMTIDGSHAFVRHLVNARRRTTRGGVFIAKAHPDSPNKIDGAYAGMLSWQAYLDAVAKGYAKKQSRIPSRIR